jgi:hypothetical protein
MLIFLKIIMLLPVPVAPRSKAWVCGRSPAEIIGSNPTGDINVCRECCVWSGRGLCDELITRPEESYRLWCVVVCDLETSVMRRSQRHWVSCAKYKQTNKQTMVLLNVTSVSIYTLAARYMISLLLFWC